MPFAAKYFSTTTTAVTLGVLWTAVPAGLLLAPGLWWLWSVSGGIAQGGGITLIFIAIIKLARDQASAGRMSATVQGVGYCFAAVAPPLVGFVHDAAGSWTPALLVILASVADVLRQHNPLRAAGAEGPLTRPAVVASLPSPRRPLPRRSLT